MELGSDEMTDLGCGFIDSDAGLVAALTRPTLRKAVEDSFEQLYKERPLPLNVYRSTDIILKVNCVLHTAMR